MTIEEFIAYLKNGKDQEACKSLKKEYSKSLQRHAKEYYWVTNEEGEAMTIIGIFFEYVDDKLKEGEEKDVLKIRNIKSYLHIMLRNKHIKKGKENALIKKNLDRIIKTLYPDTEDSLLNESKQKKRKLLREALPCLPEKEREVVHLFYYENLTHKEIAEALEYSSARVSTTTLNRGTTKLRKVLSSDKKTT